MIIDGNTIAEDILSTLKQRIVASHKNTLLGVFVVGSDYATEKFISIKKRKAESLGIGVNIINLPTSITTLDLVKEVKQYSEQDSVNGVLVQLPLPEHIDTELVLDNVPVEKDIDVLSPASKKAFENGDLDILPPVVGSIKKIVDESGVSLAGKKAVVVGKGTLVGKPSAVWLKDQGADVTVLDASTNNIETHIKEADIIVSGAGVPRLITPDMIKDGAILFDAGTSESGGELVGDAAKECADKCEIFTPTPGGIGPITIAILLQNLVSRVLK